MNTIARSEIEASTPALSWGAVIGGWLFAFAFALLLYLLGGAAGFTTVAAADQIVTGVLAATGVWMVLSWIIATFSGSWLAGRLARHSGMAHGALVWALSGVMTILATGLLSGAAVITGIEASEVAVQAGAAVPEQAEQAAATAVQEGRAALEQAAANVQAGAAQAAEKAGDVSSATLWGMFFASLLGLLSGIFGGYLGEAGARRRLEGETLTIEQRDSLYKSA